jgi:hypothetical protein
MKITRVICDKCKKETGRYKELSIPFTYMEINANSIGFLDYNNLQFCHLCFKELIDIFNNWREQ